MANDATSGIAGFKGNNVDEDEEGVKEITKNFGQMSNVVSSCEEMHATTSKRVIMDREIVVLTVGETGLGIPSLPCFPPLQNFQIYTLRNQFITNPTAALLFAEMMLSTDDVRNRQSVMKKRRREVDELQRQGQENA